jgi:CheY-like chemotaxis protein
LLADDSVTIRKVVELTFANEGIDVSTVADADAAMQKFVEIQPDIVLVDVGLRETSGYHFCEMIKQDEATQHIPVLLLVGSFEPFDQDEAERVKADGFLTKPFQSIRDLVSRVSELLRPDDVVEPVTAETADIDSLYESSIAETVGVEDLDTIDDLLGDSGMDDKMIMASYPVESGAETDADFGAAIDYDEPVKEFGWFPESLMDEGEPLQTVDAGFEPKFILEDTEEDVTLISEVPESADTRNIEVDPTPENDGNYTEPSPEFIALVAQQVVEGLSDRVIREIAKEAVPRIAEKLIREALEEDKKD